MYIRTYIYTYVHIYIHTMPSIHNTYIHAAPLVAQVRVKPQPGLGPEHVHAHCSLGHPSGKPGGFFG